RAVPSRVGWTSRSGAAARSQSPCNAGRTDYDCPVSDLSLPRTPVPANLLLTQGASQPGQIFVMERVPHHDGPETVLELLNRPEGFFAFRPAANHDVLLREQGDQLYLLPDEPVTMVKDGKPRKVSRQPLTDQHIYALLVEVAPSESADHIDQMTETEFEYIADRGMVRVRIVPDM